MAKTTIDPSTVGQLRKLFVENLSAGNAALEYDIATLNGGKVTVKSKFARPFVFITPIVTGTPTKYYGVDRSETYKFTIRSSDTSDEASLFWLAIGG